jgi:uncharacterized membrane protein YczE
VRRLTKDRLAHLRPASAARLGQAVAGSAVMGAGLAAIFQAKLGAPPWDVLHLALARLTGLTPGTIITAVSLLVLLLWWPLRQKPGWGTAAGAVVPGLATDRVLAGLPAPEPLIERAGLLAAGIVVFAVGTTVMLRAEQGPGVRDGLMIGACARWGYSIRTVRTALEVSVLLLGLAVAGPVTAFTTGIAGPGTLVVAAVLGPLLHVLLGRRAGRRAGAWREQQ